MLKLVKLSCERESVKELEILELNSKVMILNIFWRTMGLIKVL